jgi:hypothetical protein
MTPGHFVFASRHVVGSHATTTGPPTIFISAGVLDGVWVVGADDTVGPIGLLVDRDVRYLDTLELLEPLFDFIRVDGWGEVPIRRPSRSGQVDWEAKGSARVSGTRTRVVGASGRSARGCCSGLLRAAAKPLVPKVLAGNGTLTLLDTKCEDVGSKVGGALEVESNSSVLTGWDGRRLGDRGLGAGGVGGWNGYGI